MAEKPSGGEVIVREDEPYEAVYLSDFQADYYALHPSVHARVRHTINLLKDFPTMARIYDPPYEAAAPPVPCRRAIVPKTHCCLYYTVDEKERTLYFFKLGDTRENPLSAWRFTTADGTSHPDDAP